MRVTCQSGLRGWQCPLRDNYADFAEFEQYAETYGFSRSARLPFATGRVEREPNHARIGRTL